MDSDDFLVAADWLEERGYEADAQALRSEPSRVSTVAIRALRDDDLSPIADKIMEAKFASILARANSLTGTSTAMLVTALENASVNIAQAEHNVRQLADMLGNNGVEVIDEMRRLAIAGMSHAEAIEIVRRRLTE